MVWLLQTDFLPFAYVSHRAEPVRGWFDHIRHPAAFAASQIFFALPSLFIAAALFWPKNKVPLEQIPADAFDRRIVTLLAFGPALAMIALIAVSGRGAIAMWGYPLWLFLGLWIVMVARATLDAPRLARIVAAWAAVFTLFVIVFVANYAVLPFFDHRYRAVLFPGDRLGEDADAAFPRCDRSAAALRHRLDVGRRQSRALFAGPAASADRRRAGAARRGSISTICARRAPSWCGRRAIPRNSPPHSRRSRRNAEVGAPFDLPMRRGDGAVHVGWAIVKPQ